MKSHKLLVLKNEALKAPRKAATLKPRTIEPNRFWGIDMTKIMIPVFGWVYLHVVIDWGTKKLLSCHLSLTSKSGDWIAALNEAVNLQFPNGIREAENRPQLVSDHGSQPTSGAFFKACSELGDPADFRQLQQSQRECRHRTGHPNDQGGFGLDQRI